MTSTGVVTCVSINQTSDKKFKKNIEPIANSLDIVQRLHGVKYLWRSEEYSNRRIFNNKIQMGLIAQDVEKVLPDVVSTDSDGLKSIGYTQLIPLLLEAIKALSSNSKRNDLVKNQSIRILRDDVDRLQYQVAEYKKLLQIR